MSNNDKSQKIWIVVLVAIGSGVAGGLASGIITAFLEHNSLQTQIDILQNQTRGQNNELSDQKIKTSIMNETLNAFIESTKKKSLISVKVLPHVEGFTVGGSYLYKDSGAGQPERQVNAVPSYVILNANTNATFDIVITNVGSDTAILNDYKVEYLPNGTDTYHEIKTTRGQISQILRSNSNPLIIPFTFLVTSDLAPSGTLRFTVTYDNGIGDSGAIWYAYTDSTSKSQTGVGVNEIIREK